MLSRSFYKICKPLDTTSFTCLLSLGLESLAFLAVPCEGVCIERAYIEFVYWSLT